MSKRFGAPGPSTRSPYTSRERLFYVGGGVLTFSMAALIIAVAYSYNEADAFEKLTPQEEPQQQVAFGTVVLMAPRNAIPAGTKLSHVELREIYWPRNEVPEGAIRRSEDIKDMYAKIELPSDQPILRANLSSAPLLGGLPDLIPPGHRATTIEVDATSGVEGWATPGAHVDILVTYHDASDGQKKTQIAVEDAVVLSFNGTTQRPNSNQEAGRMSDRATVTLAVPVLEAVKIHTAVAMGRISLILRNPGDVRGVSALTVSAGDFRGDQKPKKVSQENASGFVSFTDKGGSTRQLELRDNKWWKSSSDGES